MKTDLFNKSALDNLETPEQLDQQVKIMGTSSWILFAAILVATIAATIWAFIGTVSSGIDYEGVIFNNEDVAIHNTGISGIIQDVLVNEGDAVKEGDILAVIANEEQRVKIAALEEEKKQYKEGSKKYFNIQQKIEHCIGQQLVRSSTDGIVQRMELLGKAVEAGEMIALVVPESMYGYKEVVIYVPREEVGSLEIGMTVQITPSYVTREEYGYMEGVIADISNHLVTENAIIRHMGTMDYVEDILPEGSCVEVTIQLGISETSANSYVWSNPKGEELKIASGDKCRVHIVKSVYRPYELLLN